MILNDLIAIDVETSGPDPFLHDILSLALVPLNDSLPRLSIFIKHNHDLVWGEVASGFFENYKTEWQEKAISPADAYQSISRYLDELPSNQLMLVGHNVGFDFSFLKKLVFQAGKEPLVKISHRSIDTHSILYFLKLAGLFKQDVSSSDKAFSFFGISPIGKDRHTAFSDAKATNLLFKLLVNHLETNKSH